MSLAGIVEVLGGEKVLPQEIHHRLDLTGGFAKGYRTRILGVTAALSAVGLWAVGDMSLAEFVAALPVMLGGARPCRSGRQGRRGKALPPG